MNKGIIKYLKNDSQPITMSNLKGCYIKGENYRQNRLCDRRNKREQAVFSDALVPYANQIPEFKNDLMYQQTPDQDYIIQPKSMMFGGSMCITELYSKSLRVRIVKELIAQEQLKGNVVNKEQATLSEDEEEENIDERERPLSPDKYKLFSKQKKILNKYKKQTDPGNRKLPNVVKKSYEEGGLIKFHKSKLHNIGNNGKLPLLGSSSSTGDLKSKGIWNSRSWVKLDRKAGGNCYNNSNILLMSSKDQSLVRKNKVDYFQENNAYLRVQKQLKRIKESRRAQKKVQDGGTKSLFDILKEKVQSSNSNRLIKSQSSENKSFISNKSIRNNRSICHQLSPISRAKSSLFLAKGHYNSLSSNCLKFGDYSENSSKCVELPRYKSAEKLDNFIDRCENQLDSSFDILNGISVLQDEVSQSFNDFGLLDEPQKIKEFKQFAYLNEERYDILDLTLSTKIA